MHSFTSHLIHGKELDKAQGTLSMADMHRILSGKCEMLHRLVSSSSAGLAERAADTAKSITEKLVTLASPLTQATDDSASDLHEIFQSVGRPFKK